MAAVLYLSVVPALANPTAAVAKSAAQVPEVSDQAISRALRWAHTSAEQQAIMQQTYYLATQLVSERIKGLEEGTWAVALDADETVISNSRYEWELQTSGLESTPANWQAWIERREALPQPGVIKFLEQVRAWGGRIAIVTNRYLTHCSDTEANFRKYGIPYDVMLCRGEDSQKEPRWASIENGTASPDLPPLEILLWVGDNIHDFPDLTQDFPSRNEQAFSLFGTRYLVVPNPVYGSWKNNLPK